MPDMKKEVKSTTVRKDAPDDTAAPPETAPAAPRFDWMKKPRIMIPLVIFLVLYVGLNVWMYLYGTRGAGLSIKPEETEPSIIRQSTSFGNTPTPTSTPVPTSMPKPIPLYPDKGTQGIYNVSQAKNHPGPTISKVIFEPLDVQKGQTLTVFVTMNNPTPIASVSAQLTMDNGSVSFPLSHNSGTDTAGEWKGSVRVSETVWHTYKLTIRASGENGEGQVTVAPRL